jgi:hypothetical protein
VNLACCVMATSSKRRVDYLFMAVPPTALLCAIESFVHAERGGEQSENGEVREIAHPYRLAWFEEELK